METILSNLGTGILLILLFSLTIFVHELGHFLAALWCGMVVDTFSIGFGPALWKKKIRGVTYKIGWIPLGGYVALPQLDPTAMNAVQGDNQGEAVAAETPVEAEPDAEPTRVLPPVGVWQKIFVSVAGAGGNIVLAFIMAWIIYLSPDAVTGGSGTLIGHVETNSPAYLAGVRVGDEIVAVKGESVASWYDYMMLCMLEGSTNGVELTLRRDGADQPVIVPTSPSDLGVQTIVGVEKQTLCMVGSVSNGSPADVAGLQMYDIVTTFADERVNGPEHLVSLVAAHAGQKVKLGYRRDGETIEAEVTPQFNEELGRALIGIGFIPEGTIMTWMHYKKPWDQVKDDAAKTFRLLRALGTPRTSGKAAQGLGGAPMIFVLLWISIKISILSAFGFVRMLCVNLAILNLLPIPVLDGGHVVFALWEGLFRRKANPKVVNALVNVFATLVIAALLFITGRDFFRLPKLFKKRDANIEQQALATNGVEQVEAAVGGAGE